MGRYRAIIEPRVLQRLRYHFTISDHLGSPRVIFSDDDNILSTTELLHESTSAVGGLTILNSHHYDHVGRKTTDFIKINDLTEQQICAETYTAKEQIESLTLGNNLQVINYAYKGNGFLESINNPSQLGGDLWAMDLGYDAGTTAQTPNSELRKDGNITSVHWKTAGQSKRGYNYTYDYRSWLTNADYFESGKNGRYSTSYVYKDKRGNFDKIMRMGMMDGTAGQIDNLNFGYYPLTNQIRTITDGGTAAVKSGGYKSNLGDYTYNDNGAMDHDPSRGANFSLNYMDLPDEISVPDSSGSIQYLYDAMGQYHGQLEIRDGKQVASRYHIGSVEYDDGIVDQIMTSQGYVELEYAVPTHVFRTGVEPNSTQQGISVKSEASVINNRNVIYEGGQYVCLDEAFTVDVGGDFEAWIKDFPPTSFSHRYVIKDHLGSARIIFSDLDKNGSIDASEIINHFEYYPFGSFWEGDWNDNSKYNHLFTGQERQKRLGLGYDRYQFRIADPLLGRFLGVDAISDQFPHVNTYNYAENEPIGSIDLWGLQKWNVKGGIMNGPFTNQSAAERASFFGSLTSVGNVTNPLRSSSSRSFSLVDKSSNLEDPGNGYLNSNFRVFGGSIHNDQETMAGIEGSLIEGNVEFFGGSEILGIGGVGRGSLFSANANIDFDIGNINTEDGKAFGFKLDVNIGAFTAEGETTGTSSFMGLESSMTGGGSLGSAHAGTTINLLYNKETNKIVIEGLGHVGAGVGLKAGGSFKISTFGVFDQIDGHSK